MRHLETLRFVDVIARSGSIRKAADTLAITSTALNRRLLALEDELGVPIFERLPRGVRLTAAGELLIDHIRTQISDLERVRSQIAQLAGERRGHVAIACSQALLPFFLPQQISRYRAQHPGVTFSVNLRDREAAEAALIDHSVDLALVLEPVRVADIYTLYKVPQPISAVMSVDHPLAAKPKIRLHDCVPYPIALPNIRYGVRYLLEAAQMRVSYRLLPAVESDSFEFLRNYAAVEHVITFQVPIGLPDAQSDYSVPFCHRPVDGRDLPAASLYLAQLKGRVLPVAAARFAEQMMREFARRFAV